MSKSQLKTFLQGSSVSLLAQATNILIGIATVYVGIRYLGPAVFGIWMVARSIMRFYNTPQCGLDSATATLIAKASSDEERKTLLARSTLMLCGLSLLFILLTLVTLLSPSLWLFLIGPNPGISAEQVIATFIILAVSQLLRLPANAFCAAFIGLQEVYWERFYIIILPLSLNFAALLVTVFLKGHLLMLATLTGITNVVSALICCLHLFYFHPELRFCLGEKLPAHPSYRMIFHQGTRFLVIGIAALIILDTDNLVINHALGAVDVTRYAVTARLFLIAYAIINVINSALWPLYGSNVSQANWAWLNKIYNHLILILSIIATGFWVGGILFAKPIVELWAADAGYAGLPVVFFLGAYGFLLTLASSNTVLLANLNLSNRTVLASLSEAIINLILSLILVRQFGIAGVAFGTFVSNVLTTQWLLPLEIRRQSKGEMKIAWVKLILHTTITALPAILLAIYADHAFLNHSLIISLLTKTLLLAVYFIFAWLLVPKETRCYVMSLLQKASPLFGK